MCFNERSECLIKDTTSTACAFYGEFKLKLKNERTKERKNEVNSIEFY